MLTATTTDLCIWLNGKDGFCIGDDLANPKIGQFITEIAEFSANLSFILTKREYSVRFDPLLTVKINVTRYLILHFQKMSK